MSGRVIHTVSSLQIGGAERLVVDLAAVQQRQGLETAILSFGSDADPLCSQARAQGLKVVSLAATASSFGKMGVIARTLNEVRPAALHIHSPWCLPRLAPLLPFFNGNVLYMRHGAHSYSSTKWKLLHWWVHRHVDQLQFVSEQSRAVHLATYRAESVPHVVMEFGVDIPPRRVRARAAGAPVRIGCVGRLVEVKGQSILLEAMRKLKSVVPHELHLYGDGPDRDKLLALARQVDPGKIHLHGSVMDRGSIYEDLDVLVVASRMEGLSLAVMEAMAREIAIVATDVGGNSRLVTDGSTGLLVPYGDPAALATALDRLLDGEGLRLELASAARSRVESEYSLEKSAARLLPAYGLS